MVSRWPRRTLKYRYSTDARACLFPSLLILFNILNLLYRGYGTQVDGRISTTQYCPPTLSIGPLATVIVTVTTGVYPGGMGDGPAL